MMFPEFPELGKFLADISCLHTKIKTEKVEASFEKRIVRATCIDCGSLLADVVVDLNKTPYHKGFITITHLNDVFQLFYTKEGQLHMLKEFLNLHHYQIPEHWGKFDTDG